MLSGSDSTERSSATPILPAQILSRDDGHGHSPQTSGVAEPGIPSTLELASLVALTFLLFVCVIASLKGYPASVDNFGDSSAYMGLAAAIRQWDFSGIVIKQFWGLPYGMAGLSTISGISDRTSLLIFSIVPSLVTVLIARRLWNGWIAGYFAVLNFDWLQRSFLGGSEPLFMCLLLAAFLALRQQRWLLAALLASGATVVRPMGLFALVGIGVTLLWGKEFLRFAAATLIGLLVGSLYALPIARHFGNPLANVSSYHSSQWAGGWLFGLPFYAIIKGTLLYPAPWTSLILSFGWIALVVLGVIAMIRSREFRRYCRCHTVEAMFLVPYLWCLFTYNYPSWARSNFARFAIPILPFVLLALYRWLPRDRRILWAVAVLTSVLAATSAIGVSNVLHMLRNVF